LELAMVWSEGRIQLVSTLGADVFDYIPYLEGASADAQSSGQLMAPMMGKIVSVNVQEGQRVAKGQVVLVMESMKMELHVCAPYEGIMQNLRCQPGDMVERSAVLAVVAAQSD
jgi:3-methylcrotonyl-CoA carboxylase alpha subunit